MAEFTPSISHCDDSRNAFAAFPATLSRSQTRRLLLGLCLLTVALRALTAWRLAAVCDDAYYYQWVATMWEQGRTATALKYLNVNVYPLILWGLKSAGLSWPLGGMLWGLVVSGLTVLPLFGLARRLFDDRTAAVSCFLFAVHPRLIFLSIEPIREPTFWLMFLLSAYWIHCFAKSSRGWPAAMAAGIALALAIHTRTEGWALLVLLFSWPMTLAPAHVTRPRRVLRIGLALVMIPAFLLAVNLTLLRDHDRWEWGRFAPLRGLVEWLPIDLTGKAVEGQNVEGRRAKSRRKECPGGEREERGPLRNSYSVHGRKYSVLSTQYSVPSTQYSVRSTHDRVDLRTFDLPTFDLPTLRPSDLRLSDLRPSDLPTLAVSTFDFATFDLPTFDRRAGYVFVNQFAEKFEYVSLVFLLIALVCRGREWFDRDHLPMYLLFAGILLAIWVRLAQFGDINGRYFLTAYLIALPVEAVGVLIVIDRLRTWTARVAWRDWLPRMVPFAILLALATVFGVKTVMRRHKGRIAQAELGLRLREQLPPFRVIEVDRSAVRVGHFALGSLPQVSFDDEGDGPPPREPDVIISAIPVPPSVRERARHCGLVEFSTPDLQPEDSGFRVFARLSRARRIGIANRRANDERR